MKKRIISMGLAINLLLVCFLTPAYALSYDSNENIEPYTEALQEEKEVTTTEQYKILIRDINNGTVSESSLASAMNESSTDVEITEPSNGNGEEVAQQNEISTFGIVGSDNRVQVTNTKIVPYRYIAYLRSNWPNGTTSIGTAFMIGKYTAATAGHCVYDASRGGYAKDIAIWPGSVSSSIKPYSGSHANRIYLPKLYKTKKNKNYDAAMIRVNSPLGSRTGYMGLRKQKASYNKTNMYVAGYPSDHYQQQWKMKGAITKTGSYLLRYKIDTMPGQSGAPIFRLYNGKWYAIGIHTTGYYNGQTCVENGGVKFHSLIYAMLRKYK